MANRKIIEEVNVSTKGKIQEISGLYRINPKAFLF
jgi:hypothetical protein